VRRRRRGGGRRPSALALARSLGERVWGLFKPEHEDFRASLQAQVQMARVFVDQCMTLLLQGELDAPAASMAKLGCTEIAGTVIDECLQPHGGYGFMWEYPIARAYADTRVSRIYGGTSEIMKEVIARSMGLGK
jgi:acyl-CoA dehydrogenase